MGGCWGLVVGRGGVAWGGGLCGPIAQSRQLDHKPCLFQMLQNMCRKPCLCVVEENLKTKKTACWVLCVVVLKQILVFAWFCRTCVKTYGCVLGFWRKSEKMKNLTFLDFCYDLFENTKNEEISKTQHNCIWVWWGFHRNYWKHMVLLYDFERKMKKWKILLFLIFVLISCKIQKIRKFKKHQNKTQL